MTYVVGLTGGIGSGKTVASDHFGSLGVPIIDTDVVARQVVEPGQPALLKLVDAFGSAILNEQGQLIRAKLRNIAFSSDENKATLDAITHPAIRTATIEQIKAASFPYSVVVVPLLTTESAFALLMNRVLVITADTEVKIRRVQKRSQLSREEIIRIMQTQLTDKDRLGFANDVIANNSSIEHVHNEVENLHEHYLDLSSKHLE